MNIKIQLLEDCLRLLELNGINKKSIKLLDEANKYDDGVDNDGIDFLMDDITLIINKGV